MFPNQDYIFEDGFQGLSTNWYTEAFFYYKAVLVNTLPFLLLCWNVFLSDVIFLESDWWIICLTAFLYMMTNYIVCTILSVDSVYYMNWSKISAIEAYSPLVSTVCYMLIALACHFFMCLMSQTLTGRYEYMFYYYPENYGAH